MIPPFGVSSYKYDKTFLTKTDLFDFLKKKQYLSPSFRKDFWGELSKRGYKETRFETAAFEELEKITQIIQQKKFESPVDFLPVTIPANDKGKKFDTDFKIQLQGLESRGLSCATADNIRLGFYYFTVLENHYLTKLELSQDEKASLLFQIRTRQQFYWWDFIVTEEYNLLVQEAEEADRELNPDRITDPPPPAAETVSFPPLITPKPINTYAFATSKTARETVSGVVEVLTPGNPSQLQKEVEVKGKDGEPLFSYIDIQSSDSIKIQDPTLLKDELVLNVLNAVLSLYHAECSSFTLTQLYKTCTQQTGDDIHPKPKTRERYEAIIEKMRTVNAEVDYSQEAQSWGYKNNIFVKSYKRDGPLLPLIRDTAEVITGKNGEVTKVTQYHFIGEPLLYTYSILSRQIRYIPFELINTTEAINNTPNIAILKEFLIGRIEQGKKRPPVRINFDTIYARVNSRADRTQQKRIRENTEKILSRFKKNGYIAAYKKYGPSKKEYGYEITPSPAITKK